MLRLSSISSPADPEPFQSLRTCDLNYWGRPTYGPVTRPRAIFPGVGSRGEGLVKYARPESQIAAKSLSSSHHCFGSHNGLRKGGV